MASETIVYNRNKDLESAIGKWQRELSKADPWYADLLPDFRQLEQAELPPGIDSGSSFTSVCINTSIYLPWLAGQCLKAGVKIKRGIVSHISNVSALHESGKKASMIINCSGLGARSLGGLEDTSVYPCRGQTVLVRNEPNVMVGINGSDDAEDELSYVMQRAAGGEQ